MPALRTRAAFAACTAPLLVGVAAAKPAPLPERANEWAVSRTADDEGKLQIGLVEAQPPLSAAAGGAGLGAHQAALRALSLDGCLHQLSAWSGQDLSALLCIDLTVKGSGKAKVGAVSMSPEVPGLARCAEAMVERYVGPKKAPGDGRICRSIATNWTDEAREVWKRDPWATVPAAARSHPPTGLVDRPRAAPESATRRGPDGAWVNAPLGLREQPVSAALRLVEGATGALRACAADHAAWRPRAEGIDVFLDVVLNESGVASVSGAGAAPAPYADLADCAAARLDPRFPAAEGDVKVPIKVMIRPESTGN